MIDFFEPPCTMSRIETNIVVRVDINDGKIFLEGRGHWVKGQGQNHDLLKNWVWL